MMSKTAEDDSKSKRFICGVVEGFYGRPWTSDQRKELFKRMEYMMLNTYVYAPKDDLKHRAYWRDLYTPEEAEHLQFLIQTAKAHHVNFVYALSPGIDIQYSNVKEVNLVKHKLEQVKNLGCDSFALLFDDIEPTMSEADKGKFSSFAHAQVTVTNEVYEYLKEPLFFFCPTEYCESRAVPSLEASDYLNLVGKKLLPEIHVLWTGPRVISRLISPEHARKVAKVLRRPCTIWDNLHANDYDNRRVFLGPYTGRPTELKREIAGVLTNPNCECEANFVAIHTLANWSLSDGDANVQNESDATLEAGGVEPVAEAVTNRARPVKLYHPLKALTEALDAWIAEFSMPRNAFGASLTPLPPSAVTVGINTCGSATSTTSSNSSLCGAAPSGSTMSSTLPTSLINTGPVYSASAMAPTTGPLPLYTPPAVAQALRNPYAAPPLVEEATSPATSTYDIAGSDPLMAPAMQAVNSLTDEYSEPMELIPGGTPTGSGGGASPLLPRSPCISLEFQGSGILKRQHSEAKDGNAEKMGKSPQTGEESETKVASTEKKVEEETAMESEGSVDGKDITAHQDAMQVDKDEGIGDEPVPLDAIFCREDLQLLADLFYLPFEHGEQGNWLMDQYQWLISNEAVVVQAKETGNVTLSVEWFRRANSFSETCDWITSLFLKVAECPNRGLVYDLYPYFWDVQSVSSLLNTHIQWLGLGQIIPGEESAEGGTAEDNLLSTKTTAESPLSTRDDSIHPPPNELEPWVYRGGLVGCMQKLLPLEAGQDLFACRPPHPPVPQAFKIRIADESDKAAIYELCLRTFDDYSDASSRFRNLPELVGDRIVGPFLEHSPHSCFVLEIVNRNFIPDSIMGNIVGFCLAARDAQDFRAYVSNVHEPKLREKYPQELIQEKPEAPGLTESSGEDSLELNLLTDQDLLRSIHSGRWGVSESVYNRHPSLIYMRCLPEILNSSAPKRLAASVLAILKANGSHGAFCEVREGEKNVLDFFSRLGFYEITVVQDEDGESSSDVGCLGRIL